jgi:mono/diheme cytochrome c family protein
MGDIELRANPEEGMRLRARRRLALGISGLSAVGILIAAGCAGARGPVQTAEPASTAAMAAANVHAGAPTWYADVLPIVATNCVDCHQPQGMNLGGMVAPMSFASYEEARPWARLMALRVAEGYMPPWHAHPMHQGTFVGERYLSDEDKQTLHAWAEAGAPAGNPEDASIDLNLVAGGDHGHDRGDWWIGRPHLVLDFHEPYYVEDHIKDLNVGVNLRVPTDQHTEPRWIKASELRAGSHNVHHICGEPFGCIAPGWDPYVYPDGYAMLLPPVEEIRLGMHYNKVPGPGTGFHDSSRAAVIFYEDGDTIRHMVRRSVLSVGNNFVIPAGHPEYSLSREFPFEVDTYILSVTPHMHYRGKRAKYELVHPDGRTELLLYVPNYHFEWQRMYVFEDPPVAPAGSKLIWTPTWDNSTDNPYNPDPKRDVPYGLPTEDEMGNGWLDYTPVQPMVHVVGHDPIPQEILDEVTRQLVSAASRDEGRVEEGRRVGGPVNPESDDNDDR